MPYFLNVASQNDPHRQRIQISPKNLMNLHTADEFIYQKKARTSSTKMPYFLFSYFPLWRRHDDHPDYIFWLFPDYTLGFIVK